MLKYIPFIFLLTLSACGSDKSSSPTAPTPAPAAAPVAAAPVPPPRTPAKLQISGSYTCTNRFCDAAIYDITLENTGGANANINFIRIENRQFQPVLELGADHFINTFGSNLLPAGNKVDFQLNAPLGFYLVIGYRDYAGIWEIRVELNPPR